MHKDSYNKLSDKIERLNFHAFKERIEIQRRLQQTAADNNEALKTNGNLLKVIITLQILNLCKDFPAVAVFLKILS